MTFSERLQLAWPRADLPRIPELRHGLQDLQVLRRHWADRRRTRRELKRLLLVGPHMIEDVGFHQEEAEQEAVKPFWRR